MFKNIFATAAALIFTLAAAPAHASSISLLNIISSPTIGSGTLGTVTLTQNGANEVDVAVTLAANTEFVATGGPHNAFAFDLSHPSPYTVTLTSPLGAFTAVTNITNTPYGTFTNGFYCTGCGNGGSSPIAGPLDFKVTSSSGISIANFIANSSGYYFSADVIGPAGGTGNIASNSVAVSQNPLPSSVYMFAAGLLALVAFGRRKTRSSAA